MLVPAVTRKEELLLKFTNIIYTDDFWFYNGYAHSHKLPEICLSDNHYQFAIVDGETVAGFLAYKIDVVTDSIYNFGLISFDKGNLTVISDTIHQFKKLISEHNRIEWRCVGDNPVSSFYDKLCKRYGGQKVTFRKSAISREGRIIDSYLYEIVK